MNAVITAEMKKIEEVIESHCVRVDIDLQVHETQTLFYCLNHLYNIQPLFEHLPEYRKGLEINGNHVKVKETRDF